jgi:hypothetical protein
MVKFLISFILNRFIGMHFIILIDVPTIYSLFRMALSTSALVSKEIMADAYILVFLFSIEDI